MKRPASKTAPPSLAKRAGDFVEHLVEKETDKKRQKRLEFLLAKPEALEFLLTGALTTWFAPEVMCPKPWLVIEVGTVDDPQGLAKDESGLKINPVFLRNARGDRVNWKIEEQKRKVGLIRLSGQSLGFREKVSYDDLEKRARMLGFKACPHETPFQLARQHRETVIANSKLLFATGPLERWKSAFVHAGNYAGMGHKQEGLRLPTLHPKNLGNSYDLHIDIVECKPGTPYAPCREYVFECPFQVEM